MTAAASAIVTFIESDDFGGDRTFPLSELLPAFHEHYSTLSVRPFPDFGIAPTALFQRALQVAIDRIADGAVEDSAFYAAAPQQMSPIEPWLQVRLAFVALVQLF